MSKAPAVEDKLLALLRERKGLAFTDNELREVSGLGVYSFKDAMIRLDRKGMLFRWRDENSLAHTVAKEFASEAHYHEAHDLNPLYAVFGGPAKVVVTRSVPFVLLPDEDLEITRNCRYDE